jgi:hypothetical protein
MATDDELPGVIFAPNDKEVSLEAFSDATSKLATDHLGMIKLEKKESRQLQMQLGFHLLVGNSKE